MIFDLEVKFINSFKGIRYYRMNEKRTLVKYFKLCATVEPILLAFPSLYMMESGFSHVHYLRSKRRNTFNIERCDLKFKLKNLQPNIRDLLTTHQTHPSY